MTRVAVIQMVSQSDVAANLASARALLAQAAAGGARLAVLPENFAAMGRRDQALLAAAEARGEGPLLPWLRAVARDLGLWIVAGTLPLLPLLPPGSHQEPPGLGPAQHQPPALQEITRMLTRPRNREPRCP